MLMKVTMPTQIISADAAAAVRLGLRMAFCRAMVPATPRRRGSGAPSTRLIGSDTVRPRMATPKKTRTAPAPANSTGLDGCASRPVNKAAAPSASTPVPTKTRCLDP